MYDRAARISRYLEQSDWAGWQRVPLASDASARRYERLLRGDASVILMDAPPENAEDTRPFARLAHWLESVGLCPPKVLAHAPELGVMVLSDLGTEDFSHWLLRHPHDTPQLYRAAIDVLAHLHDQTIDLTLPQLTPQVAGDMVSITGEFYAKTDVIDLTQEVIRHFQTLAPHPDTLALRDVHAENLIWRPDQTGLARVGLLDFQDAFFAPAGYDLASLLRDVRRDIDAGLVENMTEYFMHVTGMGPAFRPQLACLGAQRNLRILGVFARLAQTRSKPHYIDLIPRVWENLMRDLAHPALARLRSATLDCLPAPDAALLERLRR
ncbi:phosphotransferase [Yoonia sp.]|uniref:aminoglycoside phosphotransferase family protein n=1 Tax=Yoonia sp. TaxID=2212373 RepID=UPI0019E67817|nr:phosphotransferase [Yoonia sp.]MBE0413883.1 phosphotransferase [Yoonia sp.]